MRSNYKIYQQDSINFVTSSVVQWIPIFTSKAYFEILVSSMQFCQDNKHLSVYAYVILDNHFHMVCQAPELTSVMQSLKRHTSIEIIKQLQNDNKKWIVNLLHYYKKAHKHESSHQVWQEGFHPQQMKTDEMLTQKVDYIHNNPVKRGYVLKPQDWAYSSARDYYTADVGYIKLQKLDIL